MKTIAIASDLGSTRIKAAHLTEEGKLTQIIGVDAPPLNAAGVRGSLADRFIREGDPIAYMHTAIRILQQSLKGLPPNISVGLASQRSSFLLWEKDTGKPVTSLISWQDRRAHDWCFKHRSQFSDLGFYTGLLLSPHYAGPKLAHFFYQHPDLKKAARAGKILFGTLDTFFLWSLTDGAYHQTDISMAARTLLADPRKGEWSESLLNFFDIPSLILPEIVPTFGRRIPLKTGGILTASVADQAAGLVSIMEIYPQSVLVNLGTGGFVMYPIGSEMKQVSGYLCGPVFRDPHYQSIYALEGTINGIANAFKECKNYFLHKERKNYFLPVTLTETDPAPDCFCIPDTTGVGSPFWRADIPFSLSSGAENLTPENLRRIVMEGIIFRITQILDGILIFKPDFEKKSHCILLSGGLSAENFISRGLAACTGFPVLKLTEQETTLTGAALLAIRSEADRQKPNPLRSVPVHVNGKAGVYLKEKFLRWKIWLNKIMETRRSL